ncbi:MAG: GIY-YIG nuclease family protein [Bdellovibrionales bacterium]|nr:GIY-YIG nuclease family protein [Bdellovibrionales bacterium]
MAGRSYPLIQQPVVFFDCQTTGMNPSNGSLLEIGWAVGNGVEKPSVQSTVIRQADGVKIPRRIQAITGISEKDASLGEELDAAWKKLVSCVPKNALWVIHYSKFESAFVGKLFERSSPEIICTYEIARRLLPGLGSHTIRAVCGHLGEPLSSLKRARDHVESTAYVWGKMLALLDAQGVKSLKDFKQWYEKTPPLKKGSRNRTRTYLVESATRLRLSDSPGTYHLKDCNGTVLYVGKATSLKSRVNSYFRGRQSKGSRLNEMLAQVADIKVYPAATPLEAALLENDQIKEIDPPYNKALKAESRGVFYCDKNFSFVDAQERPRYGPFSTSAWWTHWVVMLEARDKPEVLAALLSSESEAIPEPEIVLAGIRILDEKGRFPFRRTPESIRYWLSRGYTERIALLKQRRLEAKAALTEPEAAAEEDEEEKTEAVPEWDAARVARRLLKSCGHTAFRVHSGRWARRLCDCVLCYREPKQNAYRELKFRGGLLVSAKDKKAPRRSHRCSAAAYSAVSLVTLDRLRVLRTEVLRVLSGGGDAVLQSAGQAPLGTSKLKQYLFPGQFDG